MNKLSMYKFLRSYMYSILAKLLNKDYTISNLTFNCDCCPFRTTCQVGGADCKLTCAEYIKSQLEDGNDFLA